MNFNAVSVGVDQLRWSSLPSDNEWIAESAINFESFKFKYEYEGDGNDSSYQHFILHGWKGHNNQKWINDTAAGILKLKDNKAIRLDWSVIAALDYDDAVKVVKNYLGLYKRTFNCGQMLFNRLSGKEFGNYLVSQHKNGKLDLNKLTLIGHDLGAHLVGIAGKTVFEKVGKKVGKIVAASPAGPGFHLASNKTKLQKDDAHCVVVIHTDRLLFGYKFLIGGYDFFANGGFHQPGCTRVYSEY